MLCKADSLIVKTGSINIPIKTVSNFCENVSLPTAFANLGKNYVAASLILQVLSAAKVQIDGITLSSMDETPTA